MGGLFQSGQSGNPSGKKKGTKNKPKINLDVAEILKRKDCNPFEVLADVANADYQALKLTEEQKQYFSVRLRMEAAAELAQYVAPKLKSIEHKGDQDSPVSVVFNLKNATNNNV